MELHELQELFRPQLEKRPPSDGNFLGDKTFEEKFDELKSDHDNEESLLSVREYLTSCVESWKIHAGERMAFYILRDGDRREVKSVWESDFENLARTCSLVMARGELMPELEIVRG